MKVTEGKGDYRHYGDREEPYGFNNIWGLLSNFKNDLKKIRGGDWDED